ncbi:NAD(P)-binding protein [Rhizodiscina lignyota]|uniref:NAD(P)-binding protein n=1 Tax=Rhizodiscina lignyota TaxID=1504668 RepID=A0A9P4I5R6_9PEZI|nr:NAD(P)-binding protein [Rhizodiscina lignyota]
MADKVVQWESAQDGLDKLTLNEAPVPSPGEDEVLVKISTVSLNYRDTEVIMGLYTHHKSVDHSSAIVPCSDACGTIVKVGSGLKVPWKVGDRVLSTFSQTHLTGQVQARDLQYGMGLPLPGVLATYRVFPSTGLVKAPNSLTDEEASTLAIASVTAWMSLFTFDKSPLNGKTVLIQGTGGVAIAGLQIAKASGGKVIVTSSSDEKLERARKLGADYTINYRKEPQWSKKVLEYTNSEGADVIFELGGASTIRQSFDCVAFGGLIACIGYLGGKQDAPEDRTNVNVLALSRNVTLKGILNGPRDEFEELCSFYEKHGIKPVVDKTFKFDEAKEALKYLFSGGHFGKVIVKVA